MEDMVFHQLKRRLGTPPERAYSSQEMLIHSAPMPMLHLLHLLLCFALVIGILPGAHAEGVSVGAHGSSISLAGRLHASPAGVTPQGPAEALALYRRGEFERLPGNLGRGYGKEPIWLAFDIPPGPDTLRIVIAEVSPAYLDEIRAYQVNAEGGITYLGRAGDQVPLAETPLPGFQPAFPIRPREGGTILLELRTSSTRAAIVTLHPGPRYPTLQSAEGLLFGALATINLIMAMGALALFMLFRDRVYLLWLLYVLLTSTQWLALDGLLYLYYPWENLSSLNLATNILSVLLFAVGALLMTTLFQFRQIHPWLHRLFMGWATAMLVPLLAVPFVGARIVGLLAQAGLPLFLLGIGALLIQMWRGHGASRVYGPMYLIHLLASLANMMAIVGHIAFSEWTLYGWQLTSFLNLLSLQVGMFMGIRHQLRENKRLRQDLMAELSRKNVELEQQVSLRTASLSDALRNVQEAEAAQRQLLSMASHEFRTPAAVIKTSLDSLRFIANQIPPEVARRLQNIENASTRLTHLSNALIDQDRLRELAMHPKMTSLDLQGLAADTVTRYATSQPDAPDARVILGAPSGQATAPEAFTLSADPALVSIALHNLIDNALKHGQPPPGHAPAPITVTLEANADGVELRVADRGPGIPAGEKARIFERFHTLSREGVPNATLPGHGLGLSIVRAIAAAHGGTVHAEDNPGGGAILVLRLPRQGAVAPSHSAA